MQVSCKLNVRTHRGQAIKSMIDMQWNSDETDEHQMTEKMHQTNQMTPNSYNAAIKKIVITHSSATFFFWYLRLALLKLSVMLKN